MCPGRYGAVYRTETAHDREHNPANGDNDNGVDLSVDDIVHQPHSAQQPGDHAGDDTTPRNIIQYMKWGLIPSFSKEQKMMGSTFNCRDDTMTQAKSLWSGVKQRQRCLVLAEGYYEWQKKKDASVPHYVKRKDGNLMCFAGMWDFNNKGEREIFSFTVITTHAAKGIEWLHDRMPVIVDPLKSGQLLKEWLDPELKWNDNVDELKKFLVPYDPAELEIYQVSSDIGKIHNNYASLNKPLKGTITNLFGKVKKDKKNVEVKDEVKEESKDDMDLESNYEKTKNIFDDDTKQVLKHDIKQEEDENPNGEVENRDKSVPGKHQLNSVQKPASKRAKTTSPTKSSTKSPKSPTKSPSNSKITSFFRKS
jgi:putative SOS response-associated peptidase YedK